MRELPLVAEMPIFDLQLPATVALAAMAVLGYLVTHARHGRTEFTLMDALILAVVVAIAAAAGIPLLEAASRRAQTSVLRENLRTLRSQIELYKLEHHGQPPVLSEGTLPQLIRATNAAGATGEPGGKHPLGPYLRGGVPVNSVTGRSIVTPTDVFPPAAPSGNGGWIYHQATGQIAADLKEFLAE
jgi:general secretion pathway protein G